MWNLVGGLRGIAVSGLDTVVSGVVGAFNVVRHPVATAETVANAVAGAFAAAPRLQADYRNHLEFFQQAISRNDLILTEININSEVRGLGQIQINGHEYNLPNDLAAVQELLNTPGVKQVAITQMTVNGDIVAFENPEYFNVGVEVALPMMATVPGVLAAPAPVAAAVAVAAEVAPPVDLNQYLTAANCPRESELFGILPQFSGGILTVIPKANFADTLWSATASVESLTQPTESSRELRAAIYQRVSALREGFPGDVEIYVGVRGTDFRIIASTSAVDAMGRDRYDPILRDLTRFPESHKLCNSFPPNRSGWAFINDTSRVNLSSSVQLVSQAVDLEEEPSEAPAPAPAPAPATPRPQLKSNLGLFLDGQRVGSIPSGHVVTGYTEGGVFHPVGSGQTEQPSKLARAPQVAVPVSSGAKVSLKERIEGLYFPVCLKTCKGWARLALWIVSIATVIIPAIYIAYKLVNCCFGKTKAVETISATKKSGILVHNKSDAVVAGLTGQEKHVRFTDSIIARDELLM